MTPSKLFQYFTVQILLYNGITICPSSSVTLPPKMGRVNDNVTWYKTLLDANPVRYSNMDFTIHFPEKACCPILLKATYNILEREDCFSNTTLMQKEFLMRSTLFYLDPVKYGTTERKEFGCDFDFT